MLITQVSIETELKLTEDAIPKRTKHVTVFEPTCANAWWAFMHRSLSVRLSPYQKSLGNNSLQKTSYVCKYTWVRVKGHEGQGQIRFQRKAGGLTTTSSCFIKFNALC